MSSGLDLSDLGGLNITFCPTPFVAESDFPNTGGYLGGRYCGKLSPTLSCCLPCPLENLVYTDNFLHLMDASHWLNIPSLALQCLLLITFLVLPADVGHRNYLGLGLCISIIMVQLGFLIPLGTKPDMCHDTITPNDMRSSMSCAWTGAFLVTGAMACAVWVMLRSLWTHLRICWDFQHQKTFFWVAQAVGWGLPLLFLTLTLPITGVSYRLGPSCVPNQKNSFLTWFGWLIAFGCIAALLTTSTTIFCLWVYLKDLGKHSRSGKGHSTTEQSRTGDESVAPNMESGWESRNSTRRLAWTRVKKVLLMQWRSMLLSTLVIVMVMYYGTVFVKQTNTSLDAESPAKREGLTNWAICMVLNSGDKSKCDALSKILGLDEDAVIAAWFIAGLVGTFTFLLMFRRSMIGGWWFLIRHPRSWGRTESVGHEDFFIIDPKSRNQTSLTADGTKRMSFGKQLQSEKEFANIDAIDEEDAENESLNEIEPFPHSSNRTHAPHGVPSMLSPVSPISPALANSYPRHVMHSGNATPVSGILPDITETPRRHVADSKTDSAILGGPQARWSDSTTSEVEYEAGDVSRRHETTNLFDVRHGEEDHDGEIDDSSAVRKRNAKLDNMF
ncbi:hypothetical protein CB0940_05945 [Cercospora beticola]|uniref:G-protein coupled receptors family 2 profile 2 domain-containing protein n=1 Tax=Cercospora beticola TaxID=122368 RepID=A0A2G5HXA9_CERBT|nr:hypothetical protein CB0940_05945 [Cercospora beticola]PIA97168.1 hypothetical protein CB0940_05945 [Cercospora beticola]WPA98543.1 hypothetical protein RHO25_003155 [Cercospora beticola]